MERERYVYVRGSFVPEAEASVSVFDRGLLYGDGVFEGIRAYNGRVFRLVDHIDRLFASALAVNIDIPLTRSRAAEIVVEAFRRNDMRDGYVRFVVTRGVAGLGLAVDGDAEPTVVCIAANISVHNSSQYDRGLSLITAQTRRNPVDTIDPRVKSLNYMNNVMARMESNAAGADEALMLTHDGYVVEASVQNVFLALDGRLVTPPTYVGALAGITRSTVMTLAAQIGWETDEALFTTEEVYAADECFLTGTAAEVAPVVTVDGRRIGSGAPGPATGAIADAYRVYAREHGTPIDHAA